MRKRLPTVTALRTLAALGHSYVATGDHCSCTIFGCMAELEHKHELKLTAAERAEWCAQLLDGLKAIHAVYGNK